MALDEDLAEDGTSSPAASTSQVPQAASSPAASTSQVPQAASSPAASTSQVPQAASSPAASTSQVPQAATTDASEDIMCTICQDTITDEASINQCSHIFCFACILEWSRRNAVCPICRCPFQYIYRRVQANNFEMYYLVQYHSSGSYTLRSQAHFVESGQQHSSGHQHHSSSSGDHGGGRGRARARNRFPRWHHDGHSRVQHTQSYDPSSSRWQQQSRAQDTAYDEAQASRPEQDVLAFSGRNEYHQQRGWVSSREQQTTRSRSPWRFRSTWRQTQQEQQRRRRVHDEGQDPNPQWQVTVYSGRRQCHQQGGQVFSWERRVMRSRSPWRSHSAWHQTQQGQQRRRRNRRDFDEGQDPGPEWQVPAYSGRRQYHRQGGRVSSREQQATRSRSPQRSHRPARHRD